MSQLKPFLNERKQECFSYMDSLFQSWRAKDSIDFESTQSLIKELYSQLNKPEPLILECHSPWIPLSLSFAWSNHYGIDTLEKLLKSDYLGEQQKSWWKSTLEFCRRHESFSSVPSLEESSPGFGTSSDSPFLPTKYLGERVMKKHGGLFNKVKSASDVPANSLDYIFIQCMVFEELPNLKSVVSWSIYRDIFNSVINDLVTSLFDHVGNEERKKISFNAKELDSIRGLGYYNIVDWRKENRFNLIDGFRLMMRRALVQEQEPDLALLAGNLSYGLDLRFTSSFELILPLAIDEMTSTLAGVSNFNSHSKEEFELFGNLAKSASAYMFFEDVCFVLRAPENISLDDQSRFHHENRAAIDFADGYKQYYLNGRKVPALVVERPEGITVEHIDKERNVEVRRIMIDIFGIERFLIESGAKLVSSDQSGKLYKREMSGEETLAIVEVINATSEPDGSFKKYYLRVPPNMISAKEAVAWTFGLEESEYNPQTES